MFTALPLAFKWYVTSNTHNPRWKSFDLEIWDFSRLYTHFSLLFPALGSESHFFLIQHPLKLYLLTPSNIKRLLKAKNIA